MPGLVQTFLSELRRRRVLRVLAIYAVVAWLVLQVAEVTFEPLGFPEGAMRALIFVVLAGFPLAFMLAWLIELGPGGFLFDLPLWPSQVTDRRRSRRSDHLLLAAVTLMLAFGIYTALSMLQENPRDAPSALDEGRNSIAVLAFDNYDGDEQTDYFASGLAEEILNLLAGVPELNVAARTSSFQFRGRQVDVREVASTLDVRNVVEGSVQRSGDRLSVNAKLINGRSGYTLWGQRFDRTLDDVFAIQREIATDVVDELKVKLSVESAAKLNADPTDSLDAYLLYLQGAEILRSSQDEGAMQAAGALFDQALAIDADFSRALAGRCEADLRLYEIGNATRQFEAAETACRRAAELDRGQNAEIHVALARLYRFRGVNERAEAQLKLAIDIAPRSVDAHIELGELKMQMDQPEVAEASFLHAVDLKSNYWKAHEALASFYYRSRRYREAVDAYATVARLAPDIASAHSGSGAAYWMLGEVDQARSAWDRSLALKPSRQAYTNLGLRYYYGGRFDDAVQMQRKALELAPDDHRVWGRLAESLRWAGGSEAESLAAYRRAAELAEANLRINASDWPTRGLIAIYYAYSERPAEAEVAVQQAVEDAQRNAEALYYLGLVQLKLGNADAATDALAEALQRDPQYLQFLRSDPDFESLRATPRFAALIEEPKSTPPTAPDG